MSRGAQEQDRELSEALTRELQRFTGLAASLFRAAAARRGMTVTDLQVIDILQSAGPSTAGQLADLTGLTTGAITGMLNRLEEAGLVHRERDRRDGRRVIVRLAQGEREDMRAMTPLVDALGGVGDKLVSDYNEEQIALFLSFLTRLNVLSNKELLRLQEAPAREEEVFSVPLGQVERGQLIVTSGIARLVLRANAGMNDLYQARFEGTAPEMKVKDGVVTLRYPRRLLGLSGEQRMAQVMLNNSIPWEIVVQGGASDITAELGGLDLTSLDVKGGMSSIRLTLAMPREHVPVRISGGASEIVVRRPSGVAVRAHLKGWVSTFAFDDQTFSDMGNNVWLQSSDFEPTVPCYDIEILSSASMITITSDKE